jgi:UDP-N-acetylglucosamine 1-carboxyvinyltransferase
VPDNTVKQAQKQAKIDPSSVVSIAPAPRKKTGMDRLCIQGGQELHGTIKVSGAKNAALKHMCASLLTDGALQLNNCPTGLADVETLSALLSHMGATVMQPDSDTVIIKADNITSCLAPYDLVRKMRASVLVLGPLLARFAKAEVSLPGGCAIGTRPIDMHLDALEEMGAEILIDEGYVKATVPAGRLNGAEINFAKVSVGATENIMMAATLAKGETVLTNAAQEPEIKDLGECLIKMGAQIEGLGTSEIRIQGVEKLNGCVHEVLSDRIETGTWMIAVALTGGKVRLQNAHIDHLKALIGPLETAGVKIEEDGEDIIVSRNGESLVGTDIMTEPHPGFPTDLQAQFMTMLTQCEGAGMVTETIFENRFMHVPELTRMGANITPQGNSAIVRGVDKLKGAEVMATDLRASVALVLAGMVAEGETIVNRIYHLDRGYENIVEKLQACGAKIERIPPA